MSLNDRIIYRTKRDRLRLSGAISRWHVRRELRTLSRMHLSDGMPQLAVFAFDGISNSITVDGMYERRELETLLTWLHTVSHDAFLGIAIDIGANIGNHSLAFARHFLRVLSFEPNPQTFELLRVNSRLSKQVEPYCMGMSDRTSEAVLTFSAHNFGAATMDRATGANSCTVQLKRLDDVLQSDTVLKPNERVRLIKIDVEGHELQVVCGAEATIKNHQPIILFEQRESDFRGGRSSVVDRLQELGYSRFAIMRSHPVIAPQRLLAINRLFDVISRMAFGSAMEIVLPDRIDPGFYSFVIAIPKWVPSLTATNFSVSKQ